MHEQLPFEVTEEVHARPLRVHAFYYRAPAAKVFSGRAPGHVRFTPESRHVRCTSECRPWAKSGHYSITSSALARSLGGTSRPRALAVFRLKTSSYLVGACTGR